MGRDQRCDRGERPFVRADVICRRRHKTEFIADAWDGEVWIELSSMVRNRGGGGGEEPFISLFMITPVSGTMMWEPKKRLIVVVIERAMPEESAATMCEVP